MLDPGRPRNDPHASRRASRRFTAAFVVIRAARPGRAGRKGGAKKPRLPPGPTDGEGLGSRRSVPGGSAVARLPAPGEANAPPVLLARLAMLLAQRSPPARQRLRGPKGRCSRRRPRARAGDPRRDGTAPPPHRPHHRTMPRRSRRWGEDAGGFGSGEKFGRRGRAATRKGAGDQVVGRRGRMRGVRSCPLMRLPGCIPQVRPSRLGIASSERERRSLLARLTPQDEVGCVLHDGFRLDARHARHPPPHPEVRAPGDAPASSGGEPRRTHSADAGLALWSGYPNHHPSCPGLSRASTNSLQGAVVKSWMPATRAGMTVAGPERAPSHRMPPLPVRERVPASAGG